MFSIFRAVPTCEALFNFSSLASLSCLSRTCKFARITTNDYLSRKFNVEKLLRYFFSNNTDFRLLMANEGVILSGISVLLFIARRSVPEEASLDIVVNITNAKNVYDWLIANSEPRYSFILSEAQKKQGWTTADEIAAAFACYRRRFLDVDDPGLSEEAFTMRYGTPPVLFFASCRTKICLHLTHDNPLCRVLSSRSSKLKMIGLGCRLMRLQAL